MIFKDKFYFGCEYDEIYTLKGVTENFIVSKEGKLGLVNSKGQEIIKAIYTNISTLKEGYKNEYIITDENGNMGVISTSGKILISPEYSDIKYLNSSEFFGVKKDDKWQIAKIDGTVLDLGYEEYYSIKGENVIAKKSGKYGIVNLNNEVIIEPSYDTLEYMNSVYYIASKDGKYGIININNETVIPFEYLSINYVEKGDFVIANNDDVTSTIFDSNLAQKLAGIVSEVNTDKNYIKVHVDGEYKYYNFKFEEKKESEVSGNATLFLSKKDGKYGYVNADGNVVVSYIYDDGTEANICGYVAVKLNGLWGSLNQNGTICLEPSVNLDNNIYVDFIEKWHLSENGLYYEK